MKTTSLELGSLTRSSSLPPRARSRNDHEHLFSNPANAARLWEAYSDAVAGRNMIPFTVDQLRRDLGLEEK